MSPYLMFPYTKNKAKQNPGPGWKHTNTWSLAFQIILFKMMWNYDSMLGLYGSSLLQNPAANLGSNTDSNSLWKSTQSNLSKYLGI